jgi:hypothetical protein
MTAIDLALICGNATLIVLLLRAGAAKFVAPGTTAAALSEILPRGPRWTTAVRAVAAIEAAIVFAVATPALRAPAQVIVGLLGATFLILGILGKAHGSREPCGCFGTGSTRPLGTSNIMAGALVLGVAALNTWAPLPVDPARVATLSCLLAVIGSVAWLFWTSRVRIGSIIANVREEKE